MVLQVTSNQDNPFLPGNASFAYYPDQLIAGEQHRVTQNVILMAGKLVRGTVLGRQTNVSVTAAPGATNTGNGTVGSLSLGAGAEIGAYSLVATGPTTFSVTSPEGVAQPSATVGTPYVGQVNFTLAAGGTAFVAGDSFVVSYNQSAGNFVLCVKTATDGSQAPAAILADSADATSGPTKVGAYFTGEFNSNAVVYDGSWTLQDIAASLILRNLHLKSALLAADPVPAS